MNSLGNTVDKNQTAMSGSSAATDAGVLLVREAGVPFQPPLGNAAPFAEWLSLMEVVQILCPDWPVRVQPMQGKEWRL